MLSNLVFKSCIQALLHSFAYQDCFASQSVSPSQPVWVTLWWSHCVGHNVRVTLYVSHLCVLYFECSLFVCQLFQFMLFVLIFAKYVVFWCFHNSQMGQLWQVLYGSWLCHSQKSSTLLPKLFDNFGLKYRIRIVASKLYTNNFSTSKLHETKNAFKPFRPSSRKVKFEGMSSYTVG